MSIKNVKKNLIVFSCLLDCALECFERTKKNLPILPLQSLKTFQVLYNGCPKSSGQSSTTSNNTDKENTTNASHSTGGGAGGPPAAKASQSPVRSQAATRRSASPSKVGSANYLHICFAPCSFHKRVVLTFCSR